MYVWNSSENLIREEESLLFGASANLYESKIHVSNIYIVRADENFCKNLVVPKSEINFSSNVL